MLHRREAIDSISVTKNSRRWARVGGPRWIHGQLHATQRSIVLKIGEHGEITELPEAAVRCHFCSAAIRSTDPSPLSVQSVHRLTVASVYWPEIKTVATHRAACHVCGGMLIINS